MRRLFARRSILGIGVGGLGAALLASRSQAATVNYKADLKAANEVPPTKSTGTGSVSITFDPASKSLSWDGTLSGLTGPATAAHFHGPGEPGKNAGVLIWMSEKGKPLASPFKGSATLSDEQVGYLNSGLLYVNVHTAANPGGEIRGQVVKA